MATTAKKRTKSESKGTPGLTPFSQCVKAAYPGGHNEQLTAGETFKELSKKHVEGAPGNAVKHLRERRHADAPGKAGNGIIGRRPFELQGY